MNDSQVAEWREPTWKIVSNQKNPTDKSSDNGQLFTAEYIVNCAHASDQVSMFQSFMTACQIKPGLYSKYPGDTDLNSWDNYTGIVAASVKLGLTLHKDVYAYGQANEWTWNNTSAPTPSAILGRYPAFVPFLEMANGVTPSLSDQILFAASCIASACTAKSNTSGKCLQYLMNKSVFGKHRVVDVSIFLWSIIMQARYGSLKGLYAVYFGPSHPFSIYAPTEFL